MPRWNQRQVIAYDSLESGLLNDEQETRLSSSLILLVDDDELSLELITLILSTEGYRVLSMTTGSEALQLLESAGSSGNDDQAPEIVLTDMQMPDMNGRQLCQSIRDLPHPHPLLIGMSATRPQENLLQPFDAFILKPIDPQELQSILSNRRSPSSTTAQSDPTGIEAGEIPAATLDTVVLAKLRKLMPPGALDELFSSYLSDTRIRLADMERFALAGNQAEVRRSAHMMKGSAAMTGATGMSRLAAQIETGNLPLDRQRVLFRELHCACDAIEGTLARDVRHTGAHDHQNF